MPVIKALISCVAHRSKSRSRSAISGLAIFSLFIACALWGQSVPVSGPILGYVWDDTAKGIRPIKGIPGAAVAEAPVYSDSAVVSGVVSPAQDSALLLNSSGAVLCISLLKRTAPRELASGFRSDAHIVFSPSGKFALLFQPAPAQLLLITGLPDQPSATTINPDDALGSIRAAAVSDTGTMLIGSSTQIFTLHADGSDSFLGSVRQLGGMQFLRGGTDALITDEAANTLWLYRDVAGSVNPAVLATANDGLARADLRRRLER